MRVYVGLIQRVSLRLPVLSLGMLLAVAVATLSGPVAVATLGGPEPTDKVM